MKAKKLEAKERCRWSAKAKREAVLRIFRGEDLDVISRELKVTAAKLSEWREVILASGEAGLKARERIEKEQDLRAQGSIIRSNWALTEQSERKDRADHGRLPQAASGRCPGYVVDHIKPLCAGGADSPSNMQWQTVAEAKKKDRVERQQCRAFRRR